MAFVAASCDQQPVEPPEATVAESPTIDFMNGPENPGESDVWRYQWRWIFWTGHDDLNLAAEYMHAEDQGWYGTRHEYDCGGAYDHPKWDIQESGNPDVRVPMVAQRRDTPVYVYYLDDLYEAFDTGDNATFCDFIASEWLYKGEIHMVYTDNNWWVHPGVQANPFGFRANGLVWDQDENRYNYHEHVKMFCTPDDCEYTHNKLVIK
jgi:hypothetical protein